MRYHQVDIIYTVGVPEGEEGDKTAKRIFGEIMTESFTNLMKDMNISVHEAQ